jgi:hypothetical protein
MLTLVPKSWISWDFHVREAGREIAFIDRDWFRERASFTLDGETYHVRRTSVVSGTFSFEYRDVVLAEATKTSALRRAFEVVTKGGERYGLRAESVFGRTFELTRGGVRVGEVRPVSIFGRTATVRFPDSVPRPLQLFMVFLVLVLWKRTSDAAASSG